MNWWHPHNFQDRLPYLKTRMKLISAMREFFEDQGFWPVETPALQPCPGMDAHIHGFKTVLRDMGLRPKKDLYLHTSPEFAMKKLLVAGAEKIYQICSVFRDTEDTRLHSPEFTMIEWYRAHQTYDMIMDDCVNLLCHIAKSLRINSFVYNDFKCDPFCAPVILTVSEAFDQYAGMDLTQFLIDGCDEIETQGQTERFRSAIKSIGIRVAEDDKWDDLFFRVMADKIEPFLGADSPCILKEYPSNMAALARRKPEDTRFSERFELYVCGVELANAFGELTDPKEQRSRFVAEMAEKQEIYGESYPLDEDFLKALEFGMPESSGIALGVDRLVMLASGASRIKQVLWAGKP